MPAPTAHDFKQNLNDGALRDIVTESTVCPADDICNAGSIEEKLRPRTKSSKEENRKSSPAAQRGRKSNSIRPM